MCLGAWYTMRGTDVAYGVPGWRAAHTNHLQFHYQGLVLSFFLFFLLFFFQLFVRLLATVRTQLLGPRTHALAHTETRRNTDTRIPKNALKNTHTQKKKDGTRGNEGKTRGNRTDARTQVCAEHHDYAAGVFFLAFMIQSGVKPSVGEIKPFNSLLPYT